MGEARTAGSKVLHGAVAVVDDVAVGIADREAAEKVFLESADRLADAAHGVLAAEEEHHGPLAHAGDGIGREVFLHVIADELLDLVVLRIGHP